MKYRLCKIAAALLSLTLLLALAACGKSPEEQWQEQYELGMKYVSEGNYEEAILAFAAAIEIDPKSADAYAGLASVYAAQGDWESLAEILTQGKAEAEGSIYQALLALGGSLSPEEEPELDVMAVFEGMRIQEGTEHTTGNSLARDFLDSSYKAFPGLVMDLLEPVLEAGQQGDLETLCSLLGDESLWKILYPVFGRTYAANLVNHEDSDSVNVWTQWGDALIQLQCVPYWESENEFLCYAYGIQYRPASGQGFAMSFTPTDIFGERSYNFLSGEVSGYLFHGSFVREVDGMNGKITALGMAVNELVDGEYCLKGWNPDDEYYQFDMGRMTAPWTNGQGEACCIMHVDTDNGSVYYGASYDWAMEGREGWLMYPFEAPWVR